MVTSLHKHVPVVLTWKLDENGNYGVGMYGCTGCTYSGLDKPVDETSEEVHEHDSFVEGCFACKLPTLQLNAGDAKSGLSMTAKATEKELELYRSARKQGIQPKTTKTKDIRNAIDASNIVGAAYNASKS